ncbi:MAG: ABC transporter permease [Cyclobacteriaceae bacterium]
MLRNYLSVILQTIIRNKTYSLINVLGLSVALAVFMIILQYVRFEQSYDRFHTKADQIYRVILEVRNSGGNVDRDAANYAPAAPAMQNDFPEVRRFVRITPEYSKVVFSFRNKVFEEQKVYYADSTFFALFDFKLLEGNPETALAELGSVVLSQTVAEKYFGPVSTWKESPLNQIILMNNQEPFKVTGIMADFPPNSHFKANALLSFATFIKFSGGPLNSWGWNDFYSYIELAPGTDYKHFESKLPKFLAKHKGEASGDRMIVQPLTDIHLHSNVDFELNPNGSAETVYFLSVISVIILIIAWVNYINLSTARAGNRAREIGVRKVNGATRREVMIQFMLESFCINFIALMFALAIVSSVLPLISQLLEKPLAFSLLDDKMFLLYGGLAYVVGSLASGLYPAIILSAFKPVKIFKSASAGMGTGNSGLRQGLVVFQFMISAGLITGTLIIQNQMEFIRNKDLGYDHEKTIVMSASGTQKNDSLFFLTYQSLKEELLTYPEIENVTVSSALPGKSHNDIDYAGGLRMVGESDEISYAVNSFRVDADFIDVFRMKLIAGKNFSGKYVKGEEKLILNRKAAELFGYRDPNDIIGKKVHYWGDHREVVGVIENYHHKSLKNHFEPEILRNRITGMLYITVRLKGNGSGIRHTLSNLDKVWTARFPDDPFTYSFLEDHVNAQYKADLQFKTIFGIFSGFSIFIACLGLFGLVSYSVSVRIKEIGVRKVLGASISNIVLLFTKGYVRLLLIAFVMGIPLAYYILKLWIDNFAYKADIGWIVFVIPVFTVSVMSWLAVSLQVVKAALMNPVQSLRHE